MYTCSLYLCAHIPIHHLVQMYATRSILKISLPPPLPPNKLLRSSRGRKNYKKGKGGFCRGIYLIDTAYLIDVFAMKQQANITHWLWLWVALVFVKPFEHV